MRLVHYEFAVTFVVAGAVLLGFAVWCARDYRREGERGEAAVTLGVGAAFAATTALPLAALATGWVS